jgi:hypothetical protein
VETNHFFQGDGQEIKRKSLPQVFLGGKGKALEILDGFYFSRIHFELGETLTIERRFQGLTDGVSETFFLKPGKLLSRHRFDSFFPVQGFFLL